MPSLCTDEPLWSTSDGYIKINRFQRNQDDNLDGYFVKNTRRFSNHESRLLSRSHTFAIIVISDLTLYHNLNQRSLTRRWPLTLSLLRSHVWHYPRTIVSTYIGPYIHTSYYVQNEWSHSFFLNTVQARQKKVKWQM